MIFMIIYPHGHLCEIVLMKMQPVGLKRLRLNQLEVAQLLNEHFDFFLQKIHHILPDHGHGFFCLSFKH